MGWPDARVGVSYLSEISCAVSLGRESGACAISGSGGESWGLSDGENGGFGERQLREKGVFVFQPGTTMSPS